MLCTDAAATINSTAVQASPVTFGRWMRGTWVRGEGKRVSTRQERRCWLRAELGTLDDSEKALYNSGNPVQQLYE